MLLLTANIIVMLCIDRERTAHSCHVHVERLLFNVLNISRTLTRVCEISLYNRLVFDLNIVSVLSVQSLKNRRRICVSVSR